jgi:anti-anti-sigma factor
MEITTTAAGDITIISPQGRIDAVTSTDFEKELNRFTGEGHRRFLLDLNALEYISSAGLRSILAFAKALKGLEGSLVFCCLQGPVKDVFRISGFGSIFRICDSREEALREF